MSFFRRPTAIKAALNFISREASPYSSSSSSGFRSIRILGGVSIPRPPPNRPHVFSRGFSARPNIADENEPYTDWRNRPQEQVEIDGCDYKHWFIVVEPPEGNPTREEIIDRYVKTLAQVVGSEEEARMKIYSVSTKHYYAFGCLISEELSKKLEPLPHVSWVLPDSYFDIQAKDYGGEPFINGQAVPYDPKYHEQWVRNNARCNKKSQGNRSRDADRPRDTERRRDMRPNENQRPPPNNSYQPPRGNFMQGPPDSQGRREMRPNTYQRPPPNSYQAPQGNTMQGAPDSMGPREMRPNAYQRPPPNSTYQAPRGNFMQGPPDSQGRRERWPNAYQPPPPNSTDQAPQGNTMQGAPDSQGRREMGQNAYQRPPPNSTNQSSQENTMQGAPDSQGPSN